jgi:predicted transcriptional regulator
MTQALEDNVNNKIKAHIIEFPNDKPSDIAALFGVNRQKVYDARENLRRHKMIERVGKKKRSVKKAPMVFTYIEEKKDDEYEVVKLKAEIERLNVIIAYLEKKVG